MIRVLLLCLTLLSGHVLATETVLIYGSDIKDSSYLDSSHELRGKNHGGRQAFLTELVRELMIKLNHTPDIRPVEQAELLTQLDLNISQGILGIALTAETKERYKWVGPLLSDSAYFVVRKGKQVLINSINDIPKTTSICVQRDSPQVLSLNKKGFHNVEMAASYEQCWSSVAKGASELTTISAVLFPAIKKSVGRVAEQVVITDVMLYEDEVYLAFEKSTPDAVIGQWNDALEQIKTHAPQLDFTGFHAHLSSQELSAEKILTNFEAVIASARELGKTSGLTVKKINFGGIAEISIRLIRNSLISQK